MMGKLGRSILVRHFLLEANVLTLAFEIAFYAQRQRERDWKSVVFAQLQVKLQ